MISILMILLKKSKYYTLFFACNNYKIFRKIQKNIHNNTIYKYFFIIFGKDIIFQ